LALRGLDSPRAGLGFLEPIIVFGAMGFVPALRLAHLQRLVEAGYASTPFGAVQC
jgi:hypothetical protein